VGLLEDVEKRVRMPFRREGDVLALLGETRDELGGSEFLRVIRRRDEGPCPEVDIAAEKRLIDLLATLAEEGMLASAHDLSDGGLAVALAECAMTSGLGADVVLQSGVRPAAALYGETTARALVSFAQSDEVTGREAAERLHVPFRVLGRVGGDRLRINLNASALLDESVGSLSEPWTNAFARAMEAAEVL